MGISPIDLQTMYSNMNNIAKTVANQQQGVQLAQQLQESKIVQQNAEKAAQVHKAADNEAKSTSVHDDAKHHSGTSHGGDGKKRDEESPEQEILEIRESYLGNHIDIER